MTTCTKCGGSGEIEWDATSSLTCQQCGGTGVIQEMPYPAQPQVKLPPITGTAGQVFDTKLGRYVDATPAQPAPTVAPADYRSARGISPLRAGDPLPEETIRRGRDAKPATPQGQGDVLGTWVSLADLEEIAVASRHGTPSSEKQFWEDGPRWQKLADALNRAKAAQPHVQSPTVEQDTVMVRVGKSDLRAEVIERLESEGLDNCRACGHQWFYREPEMHFDSCWYGNALKEAQDAKTRRLHAAQPHVQSPTVAEKCPVCLMTGFHAPTCPRDGREAQ